MTGSTLRTSDSNTGSVLVFALAPGEDPPEFAFVPAPPEPEADADAPAEPAEAADAALPVYDLGVVAQARDSVSAFYGRAQKATARFVLARRSDPATPLCEIAYRKAVAPADLVELLRAVVEERVLLRRLDPGAEAFAVFRKDYSSDGPSTAPITIRHYTSSAMIFASSVGSPKLFFDVLDGISAAELAAGTLLAPEIRIGATVRKLNVVLPGTPRVADLVAKLRAIGAVDADAPIRVIVSTSWMVSVLTPEALLAAHQVPSVEVVPEEQRALPPGSRLLPVVIGEVTASDYFSPAGSPALVLVAADETIGDIRPRVIAALGIAETDAKNTKLFTGEKYVPFVPVNALKDEDDADAAKEVIFALPGGKRKKTSRQREEGVRIDN
jgi:hypothetical protein